jgi:hypothetical protein
MPSYLTSSLSVSECIARIAVMFLYSCNGSQ